MDSDTDSLCEVFDTLANGGPSFIGEFDFLMGIAGSNEGLVERCSPSSALAVW
jgi:hypothetical protein